MRLAATLALLVCAGGCGARPQDTAAPVPSGESDLSDASDAGSDAPDAGSDAPGSDPEARDPAEVGLPSSEESELPLGEGDLEYAYESATKGRRVDGEQQALAKEPETHPDCAVEASAGDASPFLARFREKLCTWMTPEERKRLDRIDLAGTGHADPRQLAATAHDEMLRKLAPKALKRGRERSHRRFARQLRNAPPGKTMEQGVMYDACYGDPFFQACEVVCDWDRPKTCRRCEDAWAKLEPLHIMCEPLSAETLVWPGTPEMGEGEIPASGAVYFAKLFDASVAAGVPRRAVVSHAIELLDELARQARAGAD